MDSFSEFFSYPGNHPVSVTKRKAIFGHDRKINVAFAVIFLHCHRAYKQQGIAKFALELIEFRDNFIFFAVPVLADLQEIFFSFILYDISYSRWKIYPEFAALFGTKAPNYQGMFLRGHGWQDHSKLNNRNLGTETNTRHESGNLGVVQGDAARPVRSIVRYRQMYIESNGNVLPIAIEDPLIGNIDRVHYSDPSVQSVLKDDTWAAVQIPRAVYRKNGADLTLMHLDTSLATPTANENRPVNMAVKYIIKAR